MPTTDPVEPPPQRVGTLTLIERTSRQAPALLIREANHERAEDGIEVDVIGVAGVDLDATLERIRAALDRYARIVGREIRIGPVGHPDAPSGYLVRGVQRWEVERAVDSGTGVPHVPAVVMPLTIEGRW